MQIKRIEPILKHKNFSFKSKENSDFLQKYVNLNTTGYTSIACFGVAFVSGFTKNHLLHRYAALGGMGAGLVHIALSWYYKRMANSLYKQA